MSDKKRTLPESIPEALTLIYQELQEQGSRLEALKLGLADVNGNISGLTVALGTFHEDMGTKNEEQDERHKRLREDHERLKTRVSELAPRAAT